jgi:hypothetical protein
VLDLVGAGLISAAPIDAKGRVVELGDWVRVIQAPLSIIGMPRESLDAFSGAIDNTFQVDSITRNGDLELDLCEKTCGGTIWLEACCCIITRRPSKRSKRLERRIAITLEFDAKRGRPEYRVQP